MQKSITTGSDPATETGSLAVAPTAEAIGHAYTAVLLALKGVTDHAQQFVQACDEAGHLLAAKKAEVGHGAWLPWLAANCPAISERTAQRLIRIHALASANPPRVADLGPVSSIEQVLILLQEDAKAQDAPSLPPPSNPPPSRSPLVSAMARFWGAITKRPPEKWQAEERGEFLRDLAERERIRKAQGWQLPVLDIEAEEVKP